MRNCITSRNYYIWLDLPVDKSVREASLLQRRLDEKIRFWRGDRGPDSMIYRLRCGKYHDIQKCLESMKALEVLIRDAQNEVTREFESIVKILCNSQGYITHQQIEKLLVPQLAPQWSQETVMAELAVRNITISDIQSIFSVPKIPEDYVPCTSKSEFCQVKDLLEQWRLCGAPDKECENLYTFLGLPSDASSGDLLRRVDECYRKGLYEVGNKRTVKQGLAGRAKNVFKDDASRQGYDIALKLDALGFWTNMEIIMLAQSVQGVRVMRQHDYFRTVAELVGIGLPVDHAKWLVYDYVVNKKKGQIIAFIGLDDPKPLAESRPTDGLRRGIQ